MNLSTEFIALDVQIENDNRCVAIKWADGHRSLLPIQRVRGYCPCAECQGHLAQMRFQPNQTHAILSAHLVGRYAIGFEFIDGHKTGIFRFDHLRKLDPLETEKWGLPETTLANKRAK